MKCADCGTELDGKARVEVAGKSYCWTQSRLDQLDAEDTEHKRIPKTGSASINNFRSPRTPR